MSVMVLDTETTGFAEPEIIEVAYVTLDGSPSDHITVDDQFSQRFKPNGAISYGAMATHHITPQDVEHCPPSSDFAFPEGVDYLIGHNIDFDWEVLGKPNVKRICTLALARMIWPQCDSHTLSALIYFTMDQGFAKAATQASHNALVDVQNCVFVLLKLLDSLQDRPKTWEALWELSEEARIPKTITFGKHAGTAIGELPYDYVSWLLKQDNLDPYLHQALKNMRANPLSFESRRPFQANTPDPVRA